MAEKKKTGKGQTGPVPMPIGNRPPTQNLSRGEIMRNPRTRAAQKALRKGVLGGQAKGGPPAKRIPFQQVSGSNARALGGGQGKKKK